MIAELNRALAEFGQSVTVRRYVDAEDGSTTPTDVAVKASVRPASADELIGDVDQAQLKVVLSPTGLEALLPLEKGDKIVIGGRERNVERPDQIVIADVVVRLQPVVSG